MKSMTGFGRGEMEAGGHQFTIEIKSVNHRFLETNVRIAYSLSALEAEVRSLVKNRLTRGKVDVSVQYENHSNEQGAVWVNEVKLQEYLTALRKAGKKAGLKDNLKLKDVISLPEVVRSEKPENKTEQLLPILDQAVELAIDHLEAMRLREGEILKEDFSQKLDELQQRVALIEERAPLVVSAYKEKLYARMDEYLDKAKVSALDEARLETEVTVFADRCCIDEELTRLNSHIRQYRILIESQEPVGRQLDFLTQELNRETNTIASKSNDLEITKNALAMKNIVEKIREQIQNIE